MWGTSRNFSGMESCSEFWTRCEGWLSSETKCDYYKLVIELKNQTLEFPKRSGCETKRFTWRNSRVVFGIRNITILNFWKFLCLRTKVLEFGEWNWGSIRELGSKFSIGWLIIPLYELNKSITTTRIFLANEFFSSLPNFEVILLQEQDSGVQTWPHSINDTRT